MQLEKIMEFEHVIRVWPNGTFTDAPAGIYAPEVCVSTGHDGQILDADERSMINDVRSAGWELLTGFTGQYLYSGPIMHPSEYIGGALEEHILSTPGYYAAVTVETLDDSEEAAGWAVVYHEVVTHYGASRTACGERVGDLDDCTENIPDVTCSGCIAAVHRPV